MSFHVVIPEGKHNSLESFLKKFLLIYDILNKNKHIG